MTPAWIADVVAAVMLAVAAVSAARLVEARPRRQASVIVAADVAHLLTAIAMAGMLAPALRSLPDNAWEVVFAALTVLFAFRVVREARASGVLATAGGDCAPHLVHSASMLYIYLAIPGPTAGMTGLSGMSGMSGMARSAGTAMQPHSTLAFAFALIMIGSAIWDLDQLSGRRYRLPGARVSLAGLGAAGAPAIAGVERVSSLLLSPAVTVGCRVAMGVAMAFMLLTAT